MHRRKRGAGVAAVVLAGVALWALAPDLRAAGSGPPPEEKGSKSQAEQAGGAAAKPWDQAMDLVEDERFEEARRIFEQLAVEQPKSPEILNMLAYTQRKTGDLDEAIANYHRALAIKPKFAEAREYLGEAYLQAAMREAETLRGYGGDGRDHLRKLAESFQEAAARLDADAKGKKSGGGW